MEPPSLKLVLVGGPRQGETLEFRPRSTVRIGRVVRGNNLCIKDDGISSKHLLIASEYGKWTIQDLDSSNGTSLNSTHLSPFEPCVLSHNDTVKLGESTSILVQFEELDQASQSRRYPRRGGRGVAKIEPVMEDPSLKARGSEENEEVRVVEEKPVANLESKRRGRPRKNKESDNLAPTGTEPRELRSTRGRTNGGGLVFENLEEGHREVRGSRKKRQNLQELLPEKGVKRVCVSEDEKENREQNQVEDVETKKPRRGRPRRKGLQELVVEVVKEVCIGRDDKVNKQGDFGKSETEKGQESRRKSENLQELQLEEDLREADVGEGVVEDKGSLDVEKGGEELEGKVANEEAVKGDMKVGDLEKLCEADVGEGVVGDKGRSDMEKDGEELDAKVANEEAVKGDMKVGDLENECEADVGEGAVENKGILVVEKDSEKLEAKAADEEAVKGDLTVGDLEKECGEASIRNEEGTKGRQQSGGGQAKFDWETGTLEEWFDYMEEHWPRKIIQATEEMIEEMRRQAGRVRAYIMEQKRQRGVEIVQ